MASNKKHVDHHATSFGSFMVEFLTESDRAAVILGASKVENLLGEMLDKYFLPSVSATDDLLEGDSPLGIFSARIKVCHRLGLIDDHLAKLLHIFRRLRNGFAHEVTSSSLSMGAAKDRVAAMAEPFLEYDYFKHFREKVARDMKRPISDAGVVFRTTLAMFYMHLSFTHGDLKPVSRQKQLETILAFVNDKKAAAGLANRNKKKRKAASSTNEPSA